jgi:regulator of protease activity HflC (stomatin/prohibitin superfamily)
MADITTLPLVRHLRAEPTSHVLRYRRGRLAAEGPGLAFWFRPISAAVAEVPLDDRELPFLFRARSRDFQALTVQGVITFRVADPGRLARRVDFTVDLDSGRWTEAPLEQVSGLLTQLAQQFVIDELVALDLRAILADGVAPIRDRIAAGLADEPALAELGLEVVAVRVAAVAPSAEMEKALQQPSREAIQQQADQATFQRRAIAVDSERAISENELANRIELARREEELVARTGANERRRAEEDAAAAKVAAEAEDERERLAARRKADAIDLVEQARLRAERERAEINAAVPPQVLLALALQELAGQLPKVDHLTITPDLLAPALSRLAQTAEAR